MPKPTIRALIDGVLAADRGLLAQAITLVESARQVDDAPADELLRALAPHAGRSQRIGISGVPGVGKSSLLETLGKRLVEREHHIAILAVDPTSAVSGGSILGDKTRMDRLSRDPRAFIRPTPGGGQLGGVAPRTREAILVCEAAGFDIVFVETIGIGQSEAAVRDLVDTFVLLMLTGAGDELQGIKRGVLELADVLVVTKADGDNALRARTAAAELRGAMHILHGHDPSAAPLVTTCSAQSGEGVDDAWNAIVTHRDASAARGALARRRQLQDLHWFDRRLDELLRRRFLGANRDAVAAARASVEAGHELATSAALRLANPIERQA